MKALVITTKDTAYVRDFTPPMSQTAEKVIGDWVERVRPTGLPGYLMLVDENGRLKELPVNLAGSLFYGAQFHGGAVIRLLGVIRWCQRHRRARFLPVPGVKLQLAN